MAWIRSIPMEEADEELRRLMEGIARCIRWNTPSRCRPAATASSRRIR